ncbi:hypothetical protein ACFW9U_26685 [Rhodococcus aetherivorans]|uniref:hypothetical protein n=1 Tax=Rhodococcus aetherivorans TaxID=191292 RepID=UPI00366F4A6E
MYRFVLGVDERPRPLTDLELDRLADPFARFLLRRGQFPQTLEELAAAFDATAGQPGAMTETRWFLLGDGGDLVWSPETGDVDRALRVVMARSATAGGDSDVQVSTSIEVTSEQAFLQVIGWDATAGVFNYYERRGGVWIWAGDSWHALNEPSRGTGPFDSHVNGSLVMKELKLPWSHWHSMSASINPSVLPPADPRRDAPFWTRLSGAETFESTIARPGLSRWVESRLDRVTGADHRVTELPQLARQLVTTTTVNLVSSDQQSSVLAGNTLRLPLTFFLDFDTLVGVLGLELDPQRAPTVDGDRYLRALRRVGVRLDDGRGFIRDGDTFFSFLVPERALEDIVVVQAMIDRRILSPQLATCLLLVDFPNPVYSARRAALLDYFPDSATAGHDGADLDRSVSQAIERAATIADGPEAEFTELWDRSATPGWEQTIVERVAAYLDRVTTRLSTDAGADALVRLAQGRRRTFRDSHLAEFALTLPVSDDDDRYRDLRMREDGSIH